MSTVNSTDNVRHSYLELILEFPLRRIRSEEDLDGAVAMVDRLIDKESEAGLDQGEEEYLDVLGDLVHHYESSENPIPSPSDAGVLRHLMESNELRQKDIAERTGIAVSVISEILSGKRSLNRKQVASVSKCFAVTPNVFYW